MARTDDEEDRLWSERRFRSLVEATATEVFRNAPDGRLLSDLPRWRRLTGQSFEQIQDFGWLEAVHPDDLERVDRAWRGAVIEYVGLYHDITDRVEGTRALQDALDRETKILERVIQQAPVGVALFWGPDHRYRLVNPAYEVTVPDRGGSLVGRAGVGGLPRDRGRAAAAGSRASQLDPACRSERRSRVSHVRAPSDGVSWRTHQSSGRARTSFQNATNVSGQLS